MTQTLARFRAPAIIVACIAVVGAAVLPGGFTAPKSREKLTASRPAETPKPVSPFRPQSVSIPKIDMEAPTVPVGTTADGAMGTPSNATDIAWWAGMKAGKGNVLLAAHHDWNGRTGSFYRLDELEVGDEIVVNGDKPGKEITFFVTWKKAVERDIDATDVLGPQEAETYGKDGKPVATLITCGGAFDTSLRTHVDRIVVRAELERTSGTGGDADLDPETAGTLDT